MSIRDLPYASTQRELPMNTNTIGFRWFSKSLHACALDESEGLSISHTDLFDCVDPP